MTLALSPSRLIRVSVVLSPLAAARGDFGTALALGDSDVIDGSERIRAYTDVEGVADDFGTTAPEYYAAVAYFGQSPAPRLMYIGRWIRTATAGFNRGGILTAAQQLMSAWTGITTGSFKVAIDGTDRSITGLDFSAATTLTGVAAIIDTALTTYGSCEWDGSRFKIISSTTGASSTVGYAVAAATGTNISAQLKLTSSTASALIPGYAVETPVEAVTELVDISSAWYGLGFAAATMPTNDQYLAVAAYIEALDYARMLVITNTETNTLDATYLTDISTLLKELAYDHVASQYCSNSAYAGFSYMGREFTVNFNANKSVITMMFKQEPGIVAERLTETQAQTLKNKRANVFVAYDNNTSIIQYGVQSSGAYTDEIHGLDWFRNALQTELYNLLYQSTTKIPQTDAGMTELINVAAGVCLEAVNNGLVAPGQWNADGFGQLARGNFLKTGFYIYAPLMSSQTQSVRETRVAPVMQIALKLAGAIQEADVIVNVNR